MNAINNDKVTIMIMAGGTGGHIFPGLAVAESLLSKGYRVIWLGSANGLESHLVSQANIPIFYLNVIGLRGARWSRLIAAPWVLLRSLYQALNIMQREQPAVVLGMGGFASGPGGIAARIMRKPLIIHEQNTVVGLTNRILARFFAQRVLMAFPQALERMRLHAKAQYSIVGNPIRASIQPKISTVMPSTIFRILVLGGSLGASRLNQNVPPAIAALDNKRAIEVWHQTGVNQVISTQKAYQGLGVFARATAFIEDINAAYQWADLVIARAGALTVSEIAIVGVASILVPYPYAVDDHQTLNARYLVDANAALMIEDEQCNANVLAMLIRPLCDDPERIKAMAAACEPLRKLNVADKVAELCVEYAGN